MKIVFIMLFAASITTVCNAQFPPHTVLAPEQITLDFLSSDGGFWHDCTHTKGTQPHAWVAKCQDHEFSLHLLLREFLSANETTFELHYWATRAHDKQTRTQSTWLTIDRNAKTVRLICYIGFD